MNKIQELQKQGDELLREASALEWQQRRQAEAARKAEAEAEEEEAANLQKIEANANYWTFGALRELAARPREVKAEPLRLPSWFTEGILTAPECPYCGGRLSLGHGLPLDAVGRGLNPFADGRLQLTCSRCRALLDVDVRCQPWVLSQPMPVY